MEGLLDAGLCVDVYDAICRHRIRNELSNCRVELGAAAFLGQYYFDQKNYDEAETWFNRAIKADPKEVGLDTPAATLTLTVDEEKGEGDKKTKKERTFTFKLGKRDMELGKVYVQLANWPRVNAVDLDLTKLVDRPALAYRGRGIFDFVESDLDQMLYAMKRACERMDRMREEMRKRVGEVEVAVSLIRESRDET